MPVADVDAAILAALDHTAAATQPVGDAGAELIRPLSEVARGGKRLRAQLILAAHQAHGGSVPRAAAGVAAAVELFQTAALIHDDVLDAAQTRRGRPTIHRLLADDHAQRAWNGDAEHFGLSGAILAGDLALMASYRALASGLEDLPRAQATIVSALYADMAELCTAGQYLDMRLAAEPLDVIAQRDDQILAMMRSKTASYTAEFPLALGAACASASPDAIAAMRAVGVPLGIAFQLRDDILGLVGSPETTGKPAGDDVREGKRTLLIAHAWLSASDRERSHIRAALGSASASAKELAAAVEAIVATGAVENVERHIAHLVDEARAALGVAKPYLTTGTGLEEIERLIDATTARSA
jgi:geranylgeranyl diphosphate synthase, type I